MELTRLEVLSASEIRKIHDATLDILDRCGVEIHDEPMLDALEKRGVRVDRTARRAHLSRPLVEDAISRVPRLIPCHDREGRHVFTLGEGPTKIAAGHNAVFWVDSETGATRPSTVRDVEVFARVCDNLDTIHMIGMPVMPQDVANRAFNVLYAVHATIRNSAKPLYFSTDNPAVNHAVIRMMREAYLGDSSRECYGISQLSPTSPLFWEQSVVRALEDTVREGIPLAILPEPNAGVSSPFTLAGLLTLNNAECLSGVVLAQLLRPGARVLYANSWTTTDMRSGAALVGSVETTLCRVAGAQLARHYGIPSHTTAPNSDNHAHDEQNAWEKTLSTLCSVASGNDLIVNCGMFATGMTCSHEPLVMDEEMAALALRMARGIEVTDETVAAELIVSTGPRGSYLTAPHTLERLRTGEYHVPRVAVRGGRALWEQDGSPDTTALAARVVRKLSLESRELGDPARRAGIDGVLDAAVKVR